MKHLETRICDQDGDGVQLRLHIGSFCCCHCIFIALQGDAHFAHAPFIHSKRAPQGQVILKTFGLLFALGHFYLHFCQTLFKRSLFALAKDNVKKKFQLLLSATTYTMTKQTQMHFSLLNMKLEQKHGSNRNGKKALRSAGKFPTMDCC